MQDEIQSFHPAIRRGPSDKAMHLLELLSGGKAFLHDFSRDQTPGPGNGDLTDGVASSLQQVQAGACAVHAFVEEVDGGVDQGAFEFERVGAGGHGQPSLEVVRVSVFRQTNQSAEVSEEDKKELRAVNTHGMRLLAELDGM